MSRRSSNDRHIDGRNIRHCFCDHQSTATGKDRLACRRLIAKAGPFAGICSSTIESCPSVHCSISQTLETRRCQLYRFPSRFSGSGSVNQAARPVGRVSKSARGAQTSCHWRIAGSDSQILTSADTSAASTFRGWPQSSRGTWLTFRDCRPTRRRRIARQEPTASPRLQCS
jgi:hypothetical protein